MKTMLRIFGLFFALWLIVLAVASAYYSKKIYVLNLGESTKEVSCRSFSFQPEVNTVYCDGVLFLGVREVGVR